MSPPLVVAFALAGRVDIDLTQGAARQGPGRQGRLPARHLADACRKCATRCSPRSSRKFSASLYSDFAEQNPKWNEIPSSTGDVYEWDEKSDLHSGAAVLRELLDAAGRDRRHSRRARARASSATRSRPITSRPRARSRTTSPAGQYLIEQRRRRRRTSTATARGAATIAS